MAAIPTEILIRTFFEASIDDMRKNEWILEDVFSGLACDPLSRATNGWKEVEKAVEWVKNNDIQVYEEFRIGDTPTLPCITIERVSSGEHLARTSLGDQNIITKQPPSELQRQIRKIQNDFAPKAYDPQTGLITLPKGVTSKLMAPGMYVIDIQTNQAYEIKKTLSDSSISIEPGTYSADFTEIYIAPRSQMYNVHREITYLNERFNIGIHTQSHLVTNIWLTQLVQYIMMRYKEAWLEGRGFELSTFQIGPVDLNPAFGSEMVFTRMASMTGDVPFDFIKFAAPQLDAVKGGLVVMDAPKTPDGYKVPINREPFIMEGDIDLSDLPTLGDGDE